MSCPEFEVKILEQVDGTLSPADRREVEAHLRVCPDCAEYLHQATCLDRQLSADLCADRLSSHFEENLWKRVGEERTKGSQVTREQRRVLCQNEYEARLRGMRNPFALLQPVLDNLGFGVVGGVAVYLASQAAARTGVSWGGITLQVGVLGLAGLIFAAGYWVFSSRSRLARLAQ